MTRLLFSIGLTILAAIAAPIRVGEPAPPFNLASHNGSTIALTDYAGKSKLALIFYRG